MTTRLTTTEWTIAQHACTHKQLEALDYWNHGYGYKRIALATGTPIDTIRGRIQRALNRIKPELAQQRLTDKDRMLQQQSESLQQERRRAQTTGLIDLAPCYLCGKPVLPEDRQIDHIIPRAAGGTDDHSNTAMACSNCNASKSDRIVAFTTDTREPLLIHRPRS